MEHEVSELTIPANIYELPLCEIALATPSEVARLYTGFTSIYEQIASKSITLDFKKLAQYNGLIQEPSSVGAGRNFTSVDTGLTLKYIDPTDELDAAMTIQLTQFKTGKTNAEHLEHYQLFLPETGTPWCAMVFKVIRDRSGQSVDGPKYEEPWHAFTIEELKVMSDLLAFISEPVNHFTEENAAAERAPKPSKNITMRSRIAGLFSRARRQDEV